MTAASNFLVPLPIVLALIGLVSLLVSVPTFPGLLP